MYIFREPVHIAVLLAIPPRARCSEEVLTSCVALSDDGSEGRSYSWFADLQVCEPIRGVEGGGE
jgi:hypothetical protein